LQPNIDALPARAALLRELRAFFDDRGFLEVQPPCLASDCVVDAYLDPLVISSQQLGLGQEHLPCHYYLQTSPESAMKRLLVAGAPSIYSIGPVFRAGEKGKWHNPEFTMLEWYEVGADMASGIELLGTLVAAMLGCESYDVCNYRDLLNQALNLDPIDAPLPTLCAAAQAVDSQLAATLGDDRDALLDLLLSRIVQPTLGRKRPLIVANYPLTQAALAKPSADDPQCAARFELFAQGVELANGYDELQDVDVLLARYQENNAKRLASGRSPLNVDTTLADAMRQGLPRCAGTALGVDRLLMLRCGQSCLDDVLPLPIDRA
jgi:lysyl-tRNA synthetase class 2